MGEIIINKAGNKQIHLFNYKPFRTVTKAELSRSLLSDDSVDISVESSEILPLNLGDRITVEDRTYYLNMLPPARKLAEDKYTYDLRFESSIFSLRKLKVFNSTVEGGHTNNEFPLTGELKVFLNLIINNANRIDKKWILGTFPNETEAKTMSFNNENCLAVLQRVCKEFDVEFSIVEKNEKFTINIQEKIGKTLPFSVEYGMGNGLYELSRARANDSEVVSALYAFGSSQNIPANYRDYSPRLRMPSDIGDMIKNEEVIKTFGYVEDVFTSEIKPSFTGEISNVGILDKEIQEITVSNMNFDLNEKKEDGSTKWLIAGTPAKISVTKGNLAGYDFEIVSYEHSSKKFKIKQFADERGQKFPDDKTIFKFEVGDKFSLIDIVMPDVYVQEAEKKLYEEAKKEYEKVSQNNIKYTLKLDPLFLENKGSIGIGDLLAIKDKDFGVDKTSRIISIKKDLLSDVYTSLDIADTYEVSIVKEIINDINDLQRDTRTQKEVNRQAYLDGYRRVDDRISMYFDADGKLDGKNIKAGTIDVGTLTTGAKSRWFQLEEVVFSPNYKGDSNTFKATAGRLIHFNILDKEGKARVWNISDFLDNNLSNQENYYVYAVCEVNGNFGKFEASTKQIIFDSQPEYYYFLIGYLFKSTGYGRLFDCNYGATQISGRMISTGVISDINGRPMIDLDKREIYGKVTFTDDSPALDQINELNEKKNRPTTNLLTGSNVEKRTPFIYKIGRNLEVGKTYTLRLEFDAGNNGNDPVPIIKFGGRKLNVEDAGFIKTRLSSQFTVESTDNPLNILQFEGNQTFIIPQGNVFSETTVLWASLTEGKDNELFSWKESPYDPIAKAQDEADKANNTLKDIADDNKLTPTEKKTSLTEWNRIKIEYAQNIKDAAIVKINYNNYSNAYNNLDTYITPLLSDLNSTSDIVGSVFRGKFNNYYSENVKLLTEIQNKTVDNIEIGGRNLVLDSRIDGVVENFKELDISEPLIVGEQYTLSFEAKMTEGCNRNGWISVQKISVWDDNFLNTRIYINKHEYKKYQSTFIAKTADNQKIWVYSSADYKVDIKGIKLEKGNKATDWTEAPEDLEVGIRNYVLSSGFKNLDNKMVRGTFRMSLETNDKVNNNNSIRVTGDTHNWDFLVTCTQIQEGNYIYSFWAKTISGVSVIKVESHAQSYVAEFQLTNQWKRYFMPFRAAQSFINGTRNIYHYFKSGIGEFLISSPKLEKGNKATDWLPAPEDMDDNINELLKSKKNLLIDSNKYFYVPSGNYRIGGYSIIKELEVGKTYTLMYKSGNGFRGSVGAWVNAWQKVAENTIDNGIKIVTFKCNSDYPQGRTRDIIDFYNLPDTNKSAAVNWAVLVEGDKMGLDSWDISSGDIQNAIDTSKKLQKVTSFLNTTIDGNVIATGTLAVGDVNGGNAGITGVTDQGGNSVRMFAGSTYSNKNSAPLRILDNGKMIATNAEITGTINATSGTFTGILNAYDGNFGDFRVRQNTIYSEDKSSRSLISLSSNSTYIQLSGNVGAKSISIGRNNPQTSLGTFVRINNSYKHNESYNGQPSSDNETIENVALSLNASNGTNANTALRIEDGDIRVRDTESGWNFSKNEKKGITVKYGRMTFIKGILVKIEDEPSIA